MCEGRSLACVPCRSLTPGVRNTHSWLMAMSLGVQLSQLRDVTFQRQFLHYHRAGHGAITCPQIQRGCTAFIHTVTSRVIGASGIHVASRASADDPFVRVARWQVCLVAV